MIHKQTTRYSWQGFEHEHLEKTKDWYWGLALVMITGIIISIISKNYLLALILAVGGVLLGYHANDKPELVTIEVSDRGIKFNDDMYTYETIQSFWMYEDHRGHEQLLITTGKSILPQRVVVVPEEIPTMELHEFLSQRIEEKETRPSTINIIAESFGL